MSLYFLNEKVNLTRSFKGKNKLKVKTTQAGN